MFCSRCGKTLMPEDKQCPHCGTPVGESRFEGTPYTSAQPHILPDTPAGQASAAYTRTTYTTMSDEQQQEGAVDSRTTYRPVYDEASAPREIRKDMRAAIDDAQEDKPLPPVEDLPEDVQNTLNAVDEELKMENMDTSELRTRPIESTGRAGISSEVEDYIQKLEATQIRRAARKRRAIDDREDNYTTPQEDVVYDDTQVDPDREQSEVFEDIDEEEFDEIRYGRTIGVKDILRVAGIMVLAAALIVGGVLWFRHIRSGNNGSKIEGVTQSLYASGLEQIKANRSDTYINELVNLYRSDGVLALTQRVTSRLRRDDARGAGGERRAVRLRAEEHREQHRQRHIDGRHRGRQCRRRFRPGFRLALGHRGSGHRPGGGRHHGPGADRRGQRRAGDRRGVAHAHANPGAGGDLRHADQGRQERRGAGAAEPAVRDGLPVG